MEIPKGKLTKKQQKLLDETRKGLGNFAQMFELANRASAVGISGDALCALLGCTKYNAPSAATITPEQLAIIRAAVERAEKEKGIV
jgi:hypothetical protein